jgi:hypothetical protein
LGNVEIVEPGSWGLTGLDLNDNYVFITGDLVGIVVYDVSDPYNPRNVGYYDTPGHAKGVKAMGNVAIVADEDNLGIYDCSAATGIDRAGPSLPNKFSLLPAYPNPFNSSTMIRFDLPRADHVNVSVFDILGRRIADLADADYSPGRHMIRWNGQAVASGKYLIRVRTTNDANTVPATILK